MQELRARGGVTSATHQALFAAPLQDSCWGDGSELAFPPDGRAANPRASDVLPATFHHWQAAAEHRLLEHSECRVFRRDEDSCSRRTLSYLVTERRREIGIRVALGSSAGGIVGLVLRQGLSIAGVGILGGIGAALLSARLTRSLLFGVSASDPVTYATVGSVILIVALMACIVPAYRAVRVDPLVAIRNE